jgi:D-aspartate ligase
VVIGGDYLGLGIVRSLGRHGIPVCVIDDERNIARWSRYVTRRVRVRDLRDPERTVETLMETGRRMELDGWVLYPTRDDTVAALSRHRDELATIFRVPIPAWDVIRWAWDKANTYELAASVGVPTPRTWYPKTEGDLDQIESDPPYALKPGVKERFFYATGAKAWRANSRAELLSLFRQATAVAGAGEIMVQELIAGGGDQQVAFNAYCRGGRPVASLTVQRRRQHPPEFGRASTYVETVELPELEAQSTRLLAEIGYEGLVELEYKRDPRDGVCKLLDFNARAWGYHSIAQEAGVDFPYLLYADQVGRTVEPGHARAGVRWVRLVTDTPTALLQVFRRELRLRDYLASLRNANTEAVFSRDDPLPFMAEIALLPYLMVVRGF